MTPSLRIPTVLLIVTLIATASCKKEAPAAPTTNDPVVTALEVHGMDKLKRASSFSAGIQWTVMGVKKTGKLKQRAGAMRVEYVIPYGDTVVQVSAPQACWQLRGKVVIPCDAATAAFRGRLAQLLRASWIWPLKQGGALSAKSAPVKQGDKTYDQLTVQAGGKTLGTLLFDRDKSLVVGLSMTTTLMGQQGELSGRFSKFEKACGHEIAALREYTFQGKPFMSETLSGILCETVDAGLFKQPAQVKHGLVELKHKNTSNLVCTTLKGPLDGVDAALDKVRAFLASAELAPVDAPQLIHRRGPPRVKSPKGYVTEVCLPVGKAAWVKPKGTFKGDFKLHDWEGDEVLAAYGVGDPVKLTPELAGRLDQEARKRKRKQISDLVQILYLHRPDIPAARRVSEMHATLQ